ncbi:hypothetical protein ACF073_06405 [Streptomyces sp. NPDC015171]|uniref:hypothetical protein n=1 Tax=Streptomyces sp. NPDC015171 TaxID=3364945 RepID=UPI003702659A
MPEVAVQAVALLTPAGTLVLLALLLGFAGVVLPAVWSHRPYRREAAHRVLVLLLRGAQETLRAVRALLLR